MLRGNLKIEDLTLYGQKRRVDAVNYFAKSDLPNSFFLQQFFGDKGGLGKRYWQSFAEVLCARGLPRVADVADDMLIWLQDINWPGSGTIIKFVQAHFNEFKPSIIRAVERAHSERDVIWFEWLLSYFFLNSAYAHEIVDYLDDDCWKEFDKIYGMKTLLAEMEKYS